MANFKPNQNDYKDLTPFKSWLLLQINTWGQNNFPFVESDFDELTNYGMMQKLMKAVNDVISNENLVEEDMTNIFNAFTELQNYVNNYFDNLDVQDEINNKLDNMAMDGSLTNLIKNYVDPIQEEFENDVDERLNSMQTQINSVASGSPLVASSTSEMTDTSRVYVNTSDGNWYYYNGTNWVSGGTYQSSGIADYSIEPFKTNFIEYSTKGNLYNFDSTDNLWGTSNTKGYFINKTTGEITESTQYFRQSVTHYININGCGGKTLYSKDLTGNKPWTRIAFYDGNKNFISAGTDYVNSQLIPNNAVFVRIQYGNTLDTINVDKTCVSVDNILYIPYDEKYNLKNSIESTSLYNVINNDIIENNSINERKLSILNKPNTENLFDIENSENLIGTANNDCYWSNNGGYIYHSTGGLDNIYSASYYVPIKGNQRYYFTTGNQSSSIPSFVNFYDKNKVFIEKGTPSGSPPYYYTSPENAKYLRFVIPNIDNNVMLAETYQPYSEYNNDYYLNDNIKIKVSNIEDFSDIDIANVDLLLPEKIYLIDKEPLKLYKTSFTQKYEDFGKIRLSASSTFDLLTSNKMPFNEFIDDVLYINKDDVNTTLTIKLMDNYNITKMYGKDIQIEKCNVSDKLSKTPKINMFGDSTTNNGLVYSVKSNLQELGFNPVMIGTATNYGSNNVPDAEARAGYTFAQYIGYRTIDVDDTTETPLLPFLKVATSSDKTNHPDWCFTRTNGGSANEKSYAEIVEEGGDTSQNFYIFDYAYYIQNNNLQTPNIVTIGLGINDAWKYGTNKMLEIGNLALTIMINQIHSFNQNIQIGIVPFPVSSNVKDYHVQWLYDCLQIANQFNTTFGNERVNVIAESLSQSKEMDFNYTSTSIEDSQIVEYNVGDRTHTRVWGYREGSKPITYYIVNKL